MHSPTITKQGAVAITTSFTNMPTFLHYTHGTLLGPQSLNWLVKMENEYFQKSPIANIDEVRTNHSVRL